MFRYGTQLCLAVLTALVAAGAAASAEQAPAAKTKELTNPFFALCIGTHDTKRRTPEQQAEMLKQQLDAIQSRLEELQRDQ